MQHLSRRALAGLLAAIPGLRAASAQPTPSGGQPAYPSRPVRIVVPFPPGQASDIFARVLAEGFSSRWAHPVVVENRPGGGGALAVEAVTRSAADGYTLLWGGTGITVLPAVQARLPYDVARDLSAIVRAADIPMMIVASNSGGIRNLGDLLERARARPGELVYGSGGPASLQHLTGELLSMRAGIRMSHVPYRGSAPAMADLLSGTIPLMVDSSASALPQIRAGRITAIAVASEARSPLMPEVPTVAEGGVSGVVAMGWNGLYAPAGTPPALIDRINAEANRILTDPAVVARLGELGAEPTPGSPKSFQDFTLAELAKWREVARAAELKLE